MKTASCERQLKFCYCHIFHRFQNVPASCERGPTVLSFSNDDFKWPFYRNLTKLFNIKEATIYLFIYIKIKNISNSEA